jgi:hypothetical protein
VLRPLQPTRTRIRLLSVMGRFAVMLAVAVAFGCNSGETVGVHQTVPGRGDEQGAGVAAGSDGAVAGPGDREAPRCGAALTYKANPPGHVPRFAAPVENPFGFSKVGPSGFGGALAMADLDADGDVDLVELSRPFRPENPRHTLVLKRNHGTQHDPRFSADAEPLRTESLQDSYGGFVLADLDGDCDLDVLFTGYDESSGFVLNAGSAIQADLAGERIEIDYSPLDSNGLHVFAGELADFDGDGDVDLLSIGTSRTASGWLYFENMPSGTSPPPAFSYALAEQCRADHSADNPACRPFELPYLEYFWDLEAADLDGDGDLDLLALQPEPGPGPPRGVTLYENVGSSRDALFAAGQELLALPEFSVAVSLADIDGDGDLDLFVLGWSSDGEGESIYFFEDIGR